MAYDLNDKLVIGISSRALFDLERENEIFDKHGIQSYIEYQLAHENDSLFPGTGFPLIRSILHLNKLIPGKHFVEVVILSRNSPDTGLRAFNAVEAHKGDITRAAFTGGAPIAPYLRAFKIDLFLSKSVNDAQEAINEGIAAATLLSPPGEMPSETKQIRIAFDGDAVVFSDESEKIYKERGLAAFLRHENKNKDKAMNKGPFARLLIGLSELQKNFPPAECPIRIAIVTARNSPAHTRVIKTLRTWNVNVDEAFFLGGISKDKILKAFGAHIFFDDQEVHAGPASKEVPSGLVPYKESKAPEKHKQYRRQTKFRQDDHPHRLHT